MIKIKTKEEVLEFANKVSAYYDYMAEMDKKIRICSYGKGYLKEVHIFTKEDLIELTKLFDVLPSRTSPNRLEIVINDVHFFTVDKQEVDIII